MKIVLMFQKCFDLVLSLVFLVAPLIALIGFFAFDSVLLLIIGTVIWLIETIIELPRLSSGAVFTDITIIVVGLIVGIFIDVPFYVPSMIAINAYSLLIGIIGIIYKVLIVFASKNYSKQPDLDEKYNYSDSDESFINLYDKVVEEVTLELKIPNETNEQNNAEKSAIETLSFAVFIYRYCVITNESPIVYIIALIAYISVFFSNNTDLEFDELGEYGDYLEKGYVLFGTPETLYSDTLNIFIKYFISLGTTKESYMNAISIFDKKTSKNQLKKHNDTLNIIVEFINSNSILNYSFDRKALSSLFDIIFV